MKMKTLYQLTTADKNDFFGKFAKVDIFTHEEKANAAYLEALKADKIGNLRRLTVNEQTDEEITNELIATL